MPVTRVDAKLDQLPVDFDISKPNEIARGAYTSYDAEKMQGLLVGVQVVGQRLDEERVLAMMELIEQVLTDNGKAYESLIVDS